MGFWDQAGEISGPSFFLLTFPPPTLLPSSGVLFLLFLNWLSSLLPSPPSLLTPPPFLLHFSPSLHSSTYSPLLPPSHSPPSQRHL